MGSLRPNNAKGIRVAKINKFIHSQKFVVIKLGNYTISHENGNAAGLLVTYPESAPMPTVNRKVRKRRLTAAANKR